MPRRARVQKRTVLPDPIYTHEGVAKFVNVIMQRGKKSTAESIVYGALEIIEGKTKQNPISVFEQALDNVMPSIEVRSRRVGGATYQVPVEVRTSRRQALGIRWIITAARASSGAAWLRATAPRRLRLASTSMKITTARWLSLK